MQGQQFDASNAWLAIIGDEHGGTVRLCLAFLSKVPESVCIDAINRIGRETSIGPMLNPTAYLDGRRFDNARDYIDVLNAMRPLLRVLNRLDPADGKAEPKGGG